MPVHTAYLGTSRHLDRTAGLGILQLEAEQQYLRVVEQHHNDASHSAEGSTHPGHAYSLENLEEEKL